MPRSFLFVPADSPRKIAKAAASEADALILDLEDSVPAGRKDEALRLTVDLLRQRDDAGKPLWVRLNAADEDRALTELAALPLAQVAGVVRPKLASWAEIERLSHQLDALERRDGLPRGSVGIIGIITERARALVDGASLGRPHPRLAGYTWGIEDLSAELGRAPLPGRTHAAAALAAHARLFCALTAASAGVAAIDAVDPDFRDLGGLAEACRQAAELGFVAKMAIHPAQIATIHEAMAPDAAAVTWAEKVRALEAAEPGASLFALDGRMIDRPHFTIAARILSRARRP